VGPMRKAKKKVIVRKRPSKVAVRKNTSLSLLVPGINRQAWELTDEQVTLIKNTVAKGATDDELQLFLTTARRHRLDPFTHQIWFVRRWDKNADSGKRDDKGNAILGAYVGITQVGIDGLTHVAARDHRDFGSISLPEYGPMTAGHPEWARVSVYKKGMAQPTVAEAWWEEYAPADLSKSPFWRKMPRRMLAKCAVALALRQAYPDLSGVYIPEETARMSEDYTPSGRQIVSGNEPAHTFQLPPEEEDPAVKRYEQRASEERERASKQPTPVQAQVVEQKAPEMVKALFYTHFPDSDTYRLSGSEELRVANLDLIKPLWNANAGAYVATASELGKLISQFEYRKVPFRELQGAK